MSRYIETILAGLPYTVCILGYKLRIMTYFKQLFDACLNLSTVYPKLYSVTYLAKKYRQ